MGCNFFFLASWDKSYQRWKNHLLLLFFLYDVYILGFKLFSIITLDIAWVLCVFSLVKIFPNFYCDLFLDPQVTYKHVSYFPHTEYFLLFCRCYHISFLTREHILQHWNLRLASGLVYYLLWLIFHKLLGKSMNSAVFEFCVCLLAQLDWMFLNYFVSLLSFFVCEFCQLQRDVGLESLLWLQTYLFLYFFSLCFIHFGVTLFGAYTFRTVITSWSMDIFIILKYFCL